MKGRLIFLGTGGSVGVPMIGCSCAVCHSEQAVNRRLRPSILIQYAHRQFLIDAGPDFRQQALRLGITHLDGLLLTHAHHDHTAGLDDLRPIYYRRETPLPILLSAETARDIQQRYYYLFNAGTNQDLNPRLHLQILPPDPEGEVTFENLSIRYVTYEQGGMSVNGFRLGNVAYLSDIRHFSPSIYSYLEGLDVLIISALRYVPSPMHFSVDEAIDFGKRVKAKHVYFTHLSHDLEYEQTNAYLPANMHLAYDGLEIEFKTTSE